LNRAEFACIGKLDVFRTCPRLSFTGSLSGKESWSRPMLAYNQRLMVFVHLKNKRPTDHTRAAVLQKVVDVAPLML
jgi:hypothetical protein